VYVTRDTEARSCKYCCSVKTLIITHYKCVVLSLVYNMQYACASGNLWPIRLQIIFPHYYLNEKGFEKNIERKTCVLIFSTNLRETFLILKELNEQ